MTALVENEVVQGAGRLHAGLTDPGLDTTVAAYFDPDNGFAGMTFSTVGSNPRDEIIAADLLAVSLLSIDWQPGAVRMLLGSHAALVSRLLAGMRDDIDLWEASDEDLAPVDELWQTLNAMPGVGAATVAKLLARLRGAGAPGRPGGAHAIAQPGSPRRHRGAAPAGRGRGQPAAHSRRGGLGAAQPVPGRPPAPRRRTVDRCMRLAPVPTAACRIVTAG
jgi:hypothetical protein